MIALVEGANRQKTPNEIALNILLVGLTIIFILAVGHAPAVRRLLHAHQSIIVLVALLVCLAPTTIGALLSAPSASPGWTAWCSATCWPCPAGPSRPPATCPPCCSTRPAPSPTATGWPMSSSPSAATPSTQLARVVLLASLADETPEGRSIVELAESRYGLAPETVPGAELVPFTAQTRMSGIDWDEPPDRLVGRAAATRSARARPTACAAGSRSRAARFPTTSAPSSSGSPRAAARPWSSPKARRCSGSSTSRTRSRPASRPSSTRCAPSASARS